MTSGPREYHLTVGALIKQLQALADEYGDLHVYSEVDWDFVEGVEFCPAGEHIAENSDVAYIIIR